MAVTRREFLGTTLAATAAATASTSLLVSCAQQKEDLKRLDLTGVTWHKGVCRFCGTGCGMLVGVKDNRVVAVQGDPENPVNRGLLCVKGYHAPLILYGADRLTKPLIRRNGKLEPATWDEALDLIATRWKEIIEKHGPDAVAFYGSGQWTIEEGYAALKFMKACIGTNNIEANARLCMASAVMGFMTTFGSDEPMGCYDDFEKADVFVCWGNNSAEMHPVLFSRMTMARETRQGVRLVDIAPRKTRTSEVADLFVQIRPQTDLALANGIAYLLVHRGYIDRDFIDKHVVFKRGKTDIGYGTEDGFKFKDQPERISFDDYVAFLDDYKPQRVAELCGVKIERIEELAQIYGDPATKVVSLWCMGVNQHVRGTWMNNLIYNLHLLTGKICKPGSNPLSLTGQPSACGTVREVGTLCNRLPADMLVTNPEHRKKAAEIWGIPVEKIPSKVGYHTVAMFRALDRGELKSIWIQVTNPAQTLPNAERYIEAMKRPDTFIIVSDVYPTVTTEVADVVLPSAMWVEKTGLYGNTERRTQHWPKMVDPPGEAKPDVWQIVEVARRMGYGDMFDFGDVPLEQGLFEEYRKFTLGTGKDLAPYEVYKRVRGLRWPVVNGRETPYRYVEGYDPYVPKGAGISFYKNKKDGGRAVIWARPYEPAAEEPDQEYPFWLTTGRVLEHWHTGTMTRRVPQLHRAIPEAYCELHPDDARELQISTGDRVRIVSRRGSLELPAKVGGRGTPQRGMVFVPFFDEEKLINLLTLDAFCPISKEPDYKKCAVRVEKIA